ncbi:hypothetical protein FBD94_16820 [Pedobacter hiemivivus]|uniref:Uncharacterized protein n=1 Tax=Pedobacter hiemivivus TaxID=2530454 RepID=A0A4U1G6Z7_9SPHI|nr:hypothetical protein [Pedobacter hiemivivus]TKC59194.1 hypothetical protein FBD94_16820 [Pedobacter hiemivivus]
MFNNAALDVIIGLVFIYLLYSLFATVIAEIISTNLGIRARNLKEAIDRMLNDEKEEPGPLSRFQDSFMVLKNPDNPRIKQFYDHPEIKYLGSSGIFKNPSSFKAISFSKTIVFILSNGAENKEQITNTLNSFSSEDNAKNVFDMETAKYVNSLWKESYGDIVKFKLQLEQWFDRTMEQATEWYKRKIQFILLLLGFSLAWFFNVDTLVIIDKLSNDKEARAQMVSLAIAYTQNHKNGIDAPPAGAIDKGANNKSLDSLVQVKKQLDADIAKTHTILGAGGWPPTEIKVTTDSTTGIRSYKPNIDPSALSEEQTKAEDGPISFSQCQKWGYFFVLLYNHFFGFLITAIAISLGAPFWFDLLNKLMRLRASNKEDTNSPDNSSGISPLKREA